MEPDTKWYKYNARFAKSKPKLQRICIDIESYVEWKLTFLFISIVVWCERPFSDNAFRNFWLVCEIFFRSIYTDRMPNKRVISEALNTKQ